MPEKWKTVGIVDVKRIGDCYAPGLIAAAVHSGHGYGRGVGVTDKPHVKREDNVIFPNTDLAATIHQA